MIAGCPERTGGLCSEEKSHLKALEEENLHRTKPKNPKRKKKKEASLFDRHFFVVCSPDVAFTGLAAFPSRLGQTQSLLPDRPVACTIDKWCPNSHEHSNKLAAPAGRRVLSGRCRHGGVLVAHAGPRRRTYHRVVVLDHR